MTLPVDLVALALSASSLDAAMPLHVLVDGEGRIARTGPTLLKIVPGGLVGASFFDHFEVRQPQGIDDILALRSADHARLRLRLKPPADIVMTGLALRPAGHRGVLLNLTFGISIFEAVRRFALISADFAPTDLTVEMLFLTEAKAAAMEEWRSLSKRLDTARSAALEQALTDTITGLRNRRGMAAVLDRLAEGGAPFGLMFLDLDHFKAVNDSLGHAAGDAVLKRVADVLVEEIRASDTAVRTGGDEFAIILPGITRPDALETLATRLIARIEAPQPFGDTTARISVSIGSVLRRAPGPADLSALMQAADTALYAAKGAGRGCHVFAGDLADTAL